MLVRPGEVIAERFEIERYVGAGGMGAIYRALDRTTAAPVAVKIVHAYDPKSMARFEREARALAELAHPGIVSYLAHGHTREGTNYLAMEWLDGEDLGTRLAVGKLSVQDAVACVSRVASALGVAHARGMVHRDIKPGNLFLVDLKPEQVKVLDFGVVRFAELEALTNTGALVGTPLYMAPEQATGRDVDARTDVFALGAVLFQCLTGQPPFPARDLPELIGKLMSAEDAPRVRVLAPEVPVPLDELVARMLAKDSSRRPAEANAVRAALDAGGMEPLATAATIVAEAAPSATVAELVDLAKRAQADGRWHDAKVALDRALALEDSAPVHLGLADVSFWTGEAVASIKHLETAYTKTLDADPISAAVIALRLVLMQKKIFANDAAARGWLARARRLLGADPGPVAAFLAIAEGAECSDPVRAVEHQRRALELARAASARELELIALAWLGYALVNHGDVDEGMALIDESLAATLAGEYTDLNTVVINMCAMVNACDDAADMERLVQWFEVADPFMAKYGCPLLYAECRWHYGSALFSTGRWDDAERELLNAMRVAKPETEYHIGSGARLGELYLRRGRFDEAQAMVGKLGDRPSTRRLVGAIKHSQGEHSTAAAYLQRCLDSSASNAIHASGALDLLVDASLAIGRLESAQLATRRLGELAKHHKSKVVTGHVAFAAGRCALASGDRDRARVELEQSIELFTASRLSHDAARARLVLAQVLAGHDDEIARIEARSASNAFESLGATQDASAAASLLRTLGG